MNDEDESGPDRDEGVSVQCAACRSVLAWGEDVLTVESGVAGPRGFVPLEAPLLFCSTDCLIRHFEDADADDEPARLPRRVP